MNIPVLAAPETAISKHDFELGLELLMEALVHSATQSSARGICLSPAPKCQPNVDIASATISLNVQSSSTTSTMEWQHSIMEM